MNAHKGIAALGGWLVRRPARVGYGPWQSPDGVATVETVEVIALAVAKIGAFVAWGRPCAIFSRRAIAADAEPIVFRLLAPGELLSQWSIHWAGDRDALGAVLAVDASDARHAAILAGLALTRDPVHLVAKPMPALVTR